VLSQSACTWKDTVTAAEFDLSKLTLPNSYYNGTSDTSPPYTWELNVCHVVPTEQCASESGILCNYQDGDFIMAWATWDNPTVEADKFPTWSLIEAGNPKAGVQLNFTNGVPYCTNLGKRYNRSSLIKFVCNPDRTVAQEFTVSQDETPCLYIVELETAYGCPLVPPEPSSSGFSPGSIILITVAITIPLYIIIGCIYKRKKHDTKGTESCPNVEFWRDLPTLVKDGFKYTCRGCKKGTGNAYEEL